MAHDKIDARRTRSQTRAGQAYGVFYFAEKHGLTLEQAEQLLRKHGNDRATLDREAQKLKRLIQRGF